MELFVQSTAAASQGAWHRPDRDRDLTRMRRDAYVPASAWEAASAEAKYLARVQSVALARSGAVFALQSALALERLPYGPVPEFVYTIGGSSTSGRRAGVAHSHVDLESRDVSVGADGPSRLALPYLLADVARRLPQVIAVSAVDAALASGRVQRDEIVDALLRQGKRGRRRGEWVISFADARSESVGESVSRVALFRIGAPPPNLQATVMTSLGEFRLDFEWQLRGGKLLAGEFDGAVKYGSIAQAAGETPVQALVREKRREDAIRDSHLVKRWMWREALRPALLAEVLRPTGLPLGARVSPGW